MIAFNLADWFRGLYPHLHNPVVVRDLRAQMRGVRAFAYIGGYLLLLGVLAIAGYAQATGQGFNPIGWEGRGRNIVDAQAHLEEFYYFIFGTLAVMITVIAPALTASSVVGERQRQSFDLLVTTPLTAGQLLIGKLLSSVAFLGLLLALSLPASALCILLGGATPGDVLRIYLVLAVDGVILSAIGLYFSCAVRVPMAAITWTYLAVLGYWLVTFQGSLCALNGLTTPVPLAPSLSLAWLNPYFAIGPVLAGAGSTPILVFRLVVFLGVAALLVRLLLAAATYRLGLFGAQSGVSLRRSALILAAILVGFISNALAARSVPEAVAILGTDGSGHSHFWPGLLVMAAFIVALPFLPGLFVPANPEDAPPGLTPETARRSARYHVFDPRRAFHPEHSGALPWYGAYILTVLAAMFVGAIPYPGQWANIGLAALFGGFYLLGTGVLTWCLSRLAGTLVPDLSPARATAFALIVAVFGLPTLLLTLPGGWDATNSVSALWLFSPFLNDTNPARMLEAMGRSGAVAFAAAAVVFLLDQGLRSREEGMAGRREVVVGR